MEMPGVFIARRAGEAELRQAPEEDRQRHLQFEAGKRSADAEMDACAEGDVRERRPRRIESMRMRPARRIAVRGCEDQADLLALPQPDSRELDIFKRITVEEMEGRIEAERL